MPRRKTARRLAACLLAIVMSCSMSGCITQSPDSLYALPRQSDAFYDLQDEIETVLPETVRYSAPAEGENRQPLQMQDLDGDGRKEAIVFAADSGDKPLKIYIFTQKDDDFTLASTIEGSGSAFDRVSYAQIDGSPGLELIVGRSISSDVLKSISVYSFQEGSTVELMSANYSTYTIFDLDRDGREDLFLLRFEAEQQAGTAELYRYSDGLMARDPERRLSSSASEVRRMITGYTELNVPAVFVTGLHDEDLFVTDVFAIHHGTLANIAAGSDAGDSLTVRRYLAYATDIDGDGLIELPDVRTLPDLTDPDDSTAFRLIRWFNLGLTGRKREKLLTYHDYSHGFYVVLNSDWEGRMTISRTDLEEGGTGYVFRRWNGSKLPQEEIFTLYLFTGDDREEATAAEGRFLLADKNDVSYAASLGDSEWAAELTEDTLREAFHFIVTDWKSGEM